MDSWELDLGTGQVQGPQVKAMSSSSLCFLTSKGRGPCCVRTSEEMGYQLCRGNSSFWCVFQNKTWGLLVKVSATELDGLNLISGTHTMGEENQLLQDVRPLICIPLPRGKEEEERERECYGCGHIHMCMFRLHVFACVWRSEVKPECQPSEATGLH